MEKNNAQHFLDLIKKSRRGKFKIYIGMSAGVGKTFRMLQEAQNLLRNGIDVQIGLAVTHGRAETAALLEGLPVIPPRTLFTREGKWRKWICRPSSPTAGSRHRR